MGGRCGGGSASRRGFAGAVLVQLLGCELLLSLQRGGGVDADLIVHVALASTSLVTILLAVALPAAKRWLADLAPPLALLPFVPALAGGDPLATLLAACWAPALLLATLRQGDDPAPALPRRLAAALVRTAAASTILFLGVLATREALPAPSQIAAALIALPLTIALAAHLGRRIGAALTFELSALADPSPALVLAGDEDLAALAVDLAALRARVAAEEAALAAQEAALRAQERARSAFLADLEAFAADLEEATPLAPITRDSTPHLRPPNAQTDAVPDRARLVASPSSAHAHADHPAPTPLITPPSSARALSDDRRHPSRRASHTPADDTASPQPSPRSAPHARSPSRPHDTARPPSRPHDAARPPSRPHDAARPHPRPTEAPLPRRFSPRSAPLAAAHGSP